MPQIHFSFFFVCLANLSDKVNHIKGLKDYPLPNKN